MDDLSTWIALAKTDKDKMNQLIVAYMPFVKSEASKTTVFHMEYDDKLSIAMLVFMNCIRQYEPGRGAFLPFAAVCIRNRLIDEGKRQAKYESKVTYANLPDRLSTPEDTASLDAYNIIQEKEALSEEIDRLGEALKGFGIHLAQLAEICPKQKRSRELCLKLARAMIDDEKMHRQFTETRRVSQRELAQKFHISEKTLEKYRKYIVAAALILSGDYPGIRAFLPEAEGGEVE